MTHPTKRYTQRIVGVVRVIRVQEDHEEQAAIQDRTHMSLGQYTRLAGYDRPCEQDRARRAGARQKGLNFNLKVLWVLALYST